ncbi:flagellar biosynthetic protein FliO [Sphingomonas colocasiae]|uniref:Flagellar biogenesis protein n=1 Tax=Sphingomonas colocasiae TaxID=1848973 RepID=A0ABS7PSX0_9SPHN|nr:flagellar biosynthetic protein FliO [Sphingomonas colocasiae]MBY8824437.1 flagellar biogenesis protein [Sphingomonas colocasiae]
MLWYIVKLLIILPMIAGLAYGSLRLAKHMQGRLAPNQGDRIAKIIESSMLSPGVKIAVIEFHGREILVSATRNGLATLAEAPARPRAAVNGDAK